MADDLEIHVYEDIFHVPGCVRPFRMLYHLKVVIDRSAKMASLGYNLHVSGKIAVGDGDLGVADVIFVRCGLIAMITKFLPCAHLSSEAY